MRSRLGYFNCTNGKKVPRTYDLFGSPKHIIDKLCEDYQVEPITSTNSTIFIENKNNTDLIIFIVLLLILGTFLLCYKIPKLRSGCYNICCTFFCFVTFSTVCFWWKKKASPHYNHSNSKIKSQKKNCPEFGALKHRILAPLWTESKVIEIRQGFIRGRRYKLGREFVDAFLGIPYGKPPVKELRFQKPLPADTWPNLRICTEFGARCPHNELIIERYPSIAEKSEDCLSLNVFAPSWAAETCGQPNGFAVMVFIHGGGFAIHSTAHYGCHGICESLCTKDVIVITIQYRLGFFGFSCGEEIPSNLGLWDQTLALKWVFQNIAAFGGDPNNITIFGQGAGAASADFLCLSPHSRNLFQKVATIGGSALCSFALNDKKYVSTVCLDFAKSMGYKTSPGQNHFDFLRTLPSTALEVGLIGEKVNRHGRLDLTPVFDGDFFPRPLEELRKEIPSKVILSGITEHEGLLFVGIRPSVQNPLYLEVEKLLERELLYQKVHNIDEVKKKLIAMYWNGFSKSNKKDVAKVCVNMVSDIYINNGAWKHTDAMTKQGHTVYQYCFEYCNPNGFGLFGLTLPFNGATHGMDLPYLFKKGVVSNFYPNEDDLKMIDIMTRYYTNFAKFGNPNGTSIDLQMWKPLSSENTLKYMCINLDKLRMCENLNDARSEFWKKLIDADSEKGALFLPDDKK